MEAGMHGFWDQYVNVFDLVEKELQLDPFTGYAEQGQYSPAGFECKWPVFRDKVATSLATTLTPKP
eukprot:114230-Prorocentrum_minimum.AAC.1